MIDFVIMLSDLLPYELDPRVKRGAERSMHEKRVGNWIHWQIESWKDLVVPNVQRLLGTVDTGRGCFQLARREARVDHVLHLHC